MAETTIEWTTKTGPNDVVHPGFTFNPWEGCSKVHDGCKNCYAETRANRFGTAQWGPKGTRRVTSPANWKKPLAWNRKAKELGVRLKVFCASLADVFEDWGGPIVDVDGNIPSIPCPSGHGIRDLTMADLRKQLFALIDSTPNLDWLLLTKRPENIKRMWPNEGPMFTGGFWNPQTERYYNPAYGPPLDMGFRRNVWLLTSVSDQASADKQIPELLKCRDLSTVLGLSVEPLLGALELVGASGDVLQADGGNWIDWIITGGESGPGARPMHPDWARGLRDQCAAAHHPIPFFFKQWGEWKPSEDGAFIGRTSISGNGKKRALMQVDGKVGTSGDKATPIARVGKKAAGRLLDGVEHNGMPGDLQPQLSTDQSVTVVRAPQSIVDSAKIGTASGSKS